MCVFWNNERESHLLTTMKHAWNMHETRMKHAGGRGRTSCTYIYRDLHNDDKHDDDDDYVYGYNYNDDNGLWPTSDYDSDSDYDNDYDNDYEYD